MEEAKRREAAEHARQAEEARQAAKLAAKQQELLAAQERIAAEQRQRAEAEQQKAAEAEARARDADAGRRRFKLMAIVAAALGLLAVCAALMAGWMFREADRAKAWPQVGDSLYRGVQARNELENAGPVTATLLALAALPDDAEQPTGRPWVGETAGALVEAMGVQRELNALSGHQGPVWTAAFSPGGTRIVSGSDDKTVRVWDAQSGAQLVVLRGHEDSVWAAGFSADGARIVSGSADNTVRSETRRAASNC